jgi:hypothetical protein
MKNMLILFILFFLTSKLLSQDITYFFQNLPDEALFGVSKEDRKKIIESGSGRLHESPPFSEWVQIKDLSYWFQTNGEEGTFYCTGTMIVLTMNYWEISNGNRLILIDYVGGSMGNSPTILNFYYYDGKGYKLLEEKDVIPDEILISNFFKDNNEPKWLSEDWYSYPAVRYSKKRPNLEASIYLYDKRSEYEKYGLIGDRMELIWNDGKFTKGKVYWSEKE